MLINQILFQNHSENYIQQKSANITHRIGLQTKIRNQKNLIAKSFCALYSAKIVEYNAQSGSAKKN